MIDEGIVIDRLDALLSRRDATVRETTLGAGGYDLEAGRRYLDGVVDLGLAVPTWPAEHGGAGATTVAAAQVTTLHGDFYVPDLYPFRVGLKMVGPTLLAHGSDAQRGRWLRDIASGRSIWCQMFSEPDAGSDLANVATSGRRFDDGWVLSGQKVWTSRAPYADWGICLARTDPEVAKHAGLTMFAVRMGSPGIEVRPLRQMNGDVHFSEVFLDAVVVADDDVIGAPGEGWRVAVTLLAHERSGADRSAPRAADDASLPAWLVHLSRNGSLRDRNIRDAAMSLLSYERAIRYTQERATARTRELGPGPETSGLKLHGARSFKARLELLTRAEGVNATLTGWDSYIDFLTAPSMSIRGGTDEIQRNVIAERVLGLPVEPRLDTDVPWSHGRRGQVVGRS